MTLNMAAYTTEIVGAGLDAVPRGQTEAALALGPAAASGVHQDRAAAGAQGDLSGAHQPDRHHDAGIRRRVADRGARPDLRGRHAAGPHLPRLRDLFRRHAGLSRPVDGAAPAAGRRRTPRSWRRACHDRVHLLGHRAQPAARRALDDAAVAGRLRRRRASVGLAHPVPADLQAATGAGASPPATSRCSRARRC